MSWTERLWTDDELRGMRSTIALLRRMRTAAVSTEPPRFLRFRLTLNHLLSGQEQTRSPQESLAHAEELAQAVGDFFAAKLSKTKQGNYEFEKWQDLLSDSTRQYGLYGTTTYAKTSVGEVVGDSLIGRMRNIHIDPDYMLKWDLVTHNNLGAQSIKKLVKQEVGIISPLSGDYLMACVYQSFLQRTKGKSFPVRAAALSQDLSDIVLPVDMQGNLPFVDKPAIAIYIDTIETGSTSRMLFSHLQAAYPQKTIHRPRTQRLEFTQSEKMVRYWTS